MIPILYNNYTYTARKLPFCYEPISNAIHAFRFIVGAGADPNLEIGGGSFVLFAQQAFLPSAVCYIF